MSTTREASAARSPAAWIVLGLTFALGLAADLWSKSAVFAWVLAQDPGGRPPSVTVVPGVLEFTLSTNPGIVFGYDRLPPAVVVAASLLAVVVVLYFFLTSPRRAWLLYAGLGMILAGAMGNLYDRLLSSVQLPQQPPVTNRVRDFIDFSSLELFGRAVYPWIFNIADVLLVVGAALLMLEWLRLTWRARREAATTTHGTPARKSHKGRTA